MIPSSLWDSRSSWSCQGRYVQTRHTFQGFAGVLHLHYDALGGVRLSPAAHRGRWGPTMRDDRGKM